MGYSVSVSEDGTYILVVLTGEVNRALIMEHNRKVYELAKMHGIHRYLVDATEARNTDSVSDQYDFAYKDMLTTEGVDREARTAALVSPGDHSHDFIETLSRNAGMNFKLFTDREEALAFLAD